MHVRDLGCFRSVAVRSDDASRGVAGHHLLDIETLEASEIRRLLDRARELRDTVSQSAPVLAGTSVITLFYEASTRTRASFEIAAQRLGASVITVTSSNSSVSKGESTWDTGRTLAAMDPGVIVCRHPHPGATHLLARAVESVGRTAVINAGDGAHEHPTQALLDSLTLCDRLGSVEGRTIAIIGDIAHSRVARSNQLLLTKLGARVLLGGPRSLVPASLEAIGGTIIRDVDEIIRQADAVMMLRVQFERLVGPPPFPSLADYNRTYGLNASRASLMKPDAFVMHPGPMNRGIEIDPEVADGPTSVVAHQVRNGIAARMAVLERAMRKGPWQSQGQGQSRGQEMS
ncbi:MAG: aspartate carbamoyltransferase catalytic subunit [Deltaproteobacteria bacterium]|nr:aspartate carbamoyltransferase catalytic subunit [Deltaproteobacteria bacterium]